MGPGNQLVSLVQVICRFSRCKVWNNEKFQLQLLFQNQNYVFKMAKVFVTREISVRSPEAVLRAPTWMCQPRCEFWLLSWLFLISLLLSAMSETGTNAYVLLLSLRAAVLLSTCGYWTRVCWNRRFSSLGLARGNVLAWLCKGLELKAVLRQGFAANVRRKFNPEILHEKNSRLRRDNVVFTANKMQKRSNWKGAREMSSEHGRWLRNCQSFCLQSRLGDAVMC